MFPPFDPTRNELNRRAWTANFFTGVPAPAGAITVLLPIYVNFLGVPRVGFVALLALIYTVVIALLMVSRLPVFSGKKVGTRVAPEAVLPIFVVVVLFVALLISYPWPVLTVGTLCYLLSLPFGWLSYRRYQHAAAPSREAAEPTPAHAHEASKPDAASVRPPADTPDSDRPARLN